MGNPGSGDARRLPGAHFVIKLVDPSRRGEGGRPAVTLASVFARDIRDAIARAMARYPGHIAIHGERH